MALRPRFTVKPLGVRGEGACPSTSSSHEPISRVSGEGNADGRTDPCSASGHAPDYTAGGTRAARRGEPSRGQQRMRRSTAERPACGRSQRWREAPRSAPALHAVPSAGRRQTLPRYPTRGRWPGPQRRAAGRGVSAAAMAVACTVWLVCRRWSGPRPPTRRRTPAIYWPGIRRGRVACGRRCSNAGALSAPPRWEHRGVVVSRGRAASHECRRKMCAWRPLRPVRPTVSMPRPARRRGGSGRSRSRMRRRCRHPPRRKAGAAPLARHTRKGSPPQ